MKTFFLLTISLLFGLSLYSHPSYGILVDKDQNIYFADLSHNGDGTVWKLSKNGTLKALFKNFHCHNIMLDKNDNLLTEVVVQSGNDQRGYSYNGYIIRYSKKGKIDTLNRVSGYRSLKENVYTYENGYLWKIDSSGKKRKLSNHKFQWVQSMYVDEQDNIYLPDKGVDNGILVKIDNTGDSSIIATNLIATLERSRDLHQDCILGMTKGCDEKIYLAETAGQRILKVLDNQKTEVFYKSDGDWFPTGIDFLGEDAYILEYKTKGKNEGPQIVKIDESGNKTILFNFNRYTKK